MLKNYLLHVALIAENDTFVDEYRPFSEYVKGVFSISSLCIPGAERILSFKNPIVCESHNSFFREYPELESRCVKRRAITSPSQRIAVYELAFFDPRKTFEAERIFREYPFIVLERDSDVSSSIQGTHVTSLMDVFGELKLPLGNHGN